MFKKKTNRFVCLLLSTLLTATSTSCSQQNDYSDYNKILARYSNNETVYYCFEDLDGNGIKELMVDKGKTTDLYTLNSSNEAVLVQKELIGSAFYNTDGNRFVAQADYGTGFSGLIVYEYNTEKQTVKAIDEYSVLAPIVISETYYRNGKVISQTEYHDIYETYCKEENRIVQHKYSFEKEVF